MHSWVFRNRRQLEPLYGRTPAEDRPAGPARRAATAPLAPPEAASVVAARSRDYVLIPAPRRQHP